MITLATAAYAHHNEVKAYRLGERCEKQFAPVLHLGQGDDADGTQDSAAYEVRGG